MRIHAWLAKHSDLSRRMAERQVEDGLVTIDGKVATVGQSVNGDEEIFMDKKRIRAQTITDQIMALNKPEGYECSRSPQSGKPSVYELLPELKGGKWILVGRLDVNTSGLLLVTNNGTLANRLAHPSFGFEREYLVRVNGVITQKEMAALKAGIMLEDGMAKCKHIVLHRAPKGVNAWYKVTMEEGRYRIVRRLMEEIGKEVSRLVRVRFGPVKLEKALGSGSYQVIDARIFN